ncbi:DUF3592 domain-containing protein [Streptomyces bungoensis]|uniref:DUF3592 domain-containing protein n=1 Tax=Streptomyces bungoensis TaxID=285568 RepID=UPI0033E967D5
MDERRSVQGDDSGGRFGAPVPRLRAGLAATSVLRTPRWARVRLTAAGFLLFGAVAGYLGWTAAQEDQTLQDLRAHGQRTEATVVEVAGRSEEGWAIAFTVRFATPSGGVRAVVDVGDGSESDAKPGARIPVVYDPSNSAEVRYVGQLDGHETDGIRQGSGVSGLLAAGFLVGTVVEVRRARQRTEEGEGERPDTGHPGV